jgi:hypothetical protein
LREANLDFMVVGALAVAVHGAPRTTADLDVVVHIPLERKAEVERVLRALGHADVEERRDEFGFRFAVVGPEGAEVEVFLTPPRPPYASEFQRRVFADFRGEQIPFISPEDLVLRKLVNTRLRRGLDYQDVVSVLATQGPRFDHAYVRGRCALYRVCDLFERAVKDAEAAEAA